MIETGRVEVNGERTDRLPVFVDPHNDDIRVDGRKIKPTTRHTYVMWHKPARVLATPPIDELESRPSIADYVDHPTAARLFPVGTLSFEASGLVLLTSNTKAASLLGNPRSNIERVYHVRVKGNPNGASRAKLRKGVHVLLRERTVAPPAQPRAPKTISKAAPRDDGRPKSKRVKLEVRALDPAKREEGAEGGETAGNTSVEVVTTEPRDEFVSQALHLVGHPVRKLTRVAIGPVRLREVGPGAWRELTRDEMRELRALLDGVAPSSGRSGSGKSERPGGRPGAAAGPGRRKPRVLTGEKKAADGAPVNSQEEQEERGVDPEDLDE